MNITWSAEVDDPDTRDVADVHVDGDLVGLAASDGCAGHARFSPDGARQLASVLLLAADRAERAGT